jgi:hypothetical protein
LKQLIGITSALVFLAIGSCKKTTPTGDPALLLDTAHVLQTILYKAYNTTPSPFDLAQGTPLADSVYYEFNRLVGSPDYLYNGAGMDFSISPYGTGFGFVLNSLIEISDDAVPQFPASFEQGKVYENRTSFASGKIALFVALTRNYTSGDFYFTGTIPPDGKDPLVSGPDRAAYCKIVITKKYVLHTQSGFRKMFDATISGYELNSYGLTDTTKYLQRRDFSVTFTSLSYYQN